MITNVGYQSLYKYVLSGWWIKFILLREGGGKNTFDIHICIAMKEAGKLVEFLVGGGRVQYCFFYWYVAKLSLDAMNFFLINWRNRYRN